MAGAGGGAPQGVRVEEVGGVAGSVATARERRESPSATAKAQRAARGPAPAPAKGPIVRWPSKTEETEGLETNLSSGWVEQEE